DPPQFDHEIANLAERCRTLAADVDRIRGSRTALDRGDRGSPDLQDGHDPGHAIGYPENHAKMQSPGGRRRFRTGKLALLTLFAAVAILGGLWLWLGLGTYESPDDAQINGHVFPMSARISGTVVRVYVQNTQFVRGGSPLADLDVRDYEVAVEKARADF